METFAGAADAGHATAHKAPRYMMVWLLLFILTVAEVLVAFVSHLPETVAILVLLALAVWKALLVALYYMHLKFEPRKLWVVVLVPLPLIAILLGVVLTEAW
ncbi:MAG: cytochrome C oxidase subunit IV family protein [Longimicrobiales bacterium]